MTHHKTSGTRAAAASEIRLSENQRKVIKDKYLRDAPSVESWLKGVADNIALAEVLVAPEAESWGVFEGVERRVAPVPAAGPAPSSRVLLYHAGGRSLEARQANFRRLMANLEGVCAAIPEARRRREEWAERFQALMGRWDFLPNSPTLMNAGRDLQQLSACYVLPVPDSMEGIVAALAAQSLIQKSGGGTGFSFSRLRPAGDAVMQTQGLASGALSFMRLFDTMTDVVKQGGTRRGANMAILRCDHPEIMDFIRMKQKPGVLENFNISVGVDAAFMKAALADAEYDLVNPRTGEPAGKARAKEVFDAMCESAWRTGDPGYVVLDRINESGSNPTPALGRIESTNPCGEQPLLPWEACNLGSLNLSHFVAGEPLAGRFDFPRLKEAVTLAVRFLDDVIEVNNYPLPEIEALAKGNRRIGLGVMGWAEALVKLGLPYDSPEALAAADQVMSAVNGAALEASETLAKERGVFPNWTDSIYDPASTHFRGEERHPRHCARTTIAPTGTIAIAAGLQGGGIEPFFAAAYVRRNAKALEAAKQGREAAEQDVFFEVNPLLRQAAERQDWFGLGEKTLWRRVADNHGSVRGLGAIPEQIQRVFATAHDVSPEAHVGMQAAFQRHTDNGVSKTVNMPAGASVEDVRRAYQMAYELGCKGITIYRDGSKAQQVLSLAPTPSKARRRVPESAFGLASEYYLIRTGYGPLHLHVNYDELGPLQLFANIPPLGTEISGLASLVGILISKYLAQGGSPLALLKHLNSIKGDRPIGLGASRVDSIPHAIAIALRAHLKKTGWTPEGSGGALPAAAAAPRPTLEHCPACYSSNVSFESGCSGPTCHDCGYSNCA
ncbi:MAG: adenosylcobalamin-dependent ribonucleoside-diphosphate reductase [Elusimicrobia bacterium]|nr:adenosylcobalamin-dependent ribonucleoside-diphosphate reductase [Elusimicrobiota bacterium]